MVEEYPSRLATERMKIQCTGVCVGRAGIIKCDGEALQLLFFLGISEGVNGEVSERPKSDCPAYQFEE